MSLASGSRVGAYEVLEPLGAGGMGEVYRALDPRLGREVALKILPDAFAFDPERLQRFEREAHLLASLNHPGIAAIYGLEEAGGLKVLVLELVHGETLDRRIARGPLPPEEALALARQIAEALEAAHERGIIHRDLKPANICVTPDGRSKLLDFGLAKTLEAEGGEAAVSRSPTLSLRATAHGVILGTAAYMSPEQARGHACDRRADIWGFGCVLYEMLSGRPAFGGGTVSDILAAVLRAEPGWTALPPATPPSIRRLLRRCLTRDLQRRAQHIGDVRIEIEEALPARAEPGAGGEDTGDAPDALPAKQPEARPGMRALPAALLVAIAAAGAGLGIWGLSRAPTRNEERAPRHLSIVFPPEAPMFSGRLHKPFDLSPDGSLLVYTARIGDGTQLFLRRLDEGAPRPLAGTEGGDGPFFSPDGATIAFSAGGRLRAIPVIGGPVRELSSRGIGLSEAWEPDGANVLSVDSALSRLPRPGGDSALLTTRNVAQESSHLWPDVLPNGQSVIFTIEIAGKPFDDARIVAQSLATGGRRTLLVEGGTHARFVPPGHLVYARAEALHAVRFDPDRLEVSGPPREVLKSVAVNRGTGAAYFAVARNGTLVYAPSGPGGECCLHVWVDREGREEPAIGSPGDYSEARLSPDGGRIAMRIHAADDDLWIYDLGRDTLTRLTFGFENWAPVWSPDGSRLAFTSTRAGSFNLYILHADGSGDVEHLTESPNDQMAGSWSADGRFLAFTETDPATRSDIRILEVGGPREARTLIGTPADEMQPAFSPDGRWLGYSSDASGRHEVYMQPFPGPGGRVQISNAGGTEPLWSRDGREIYYRQGNRLLAVPVTLGPRLLAEKPRVLFEGPYLAEPATRLYDASADGRRFLMVKRVQQDPDWTHINIVLDWAADLETTRTVQ